MIKTRAGDIVGNIGSVERIFRNSDLPAVTGYHQQYIWALIKQDKFPKPIRLGSKAVGWTESSIRKWQQERIAAGYKAGFAQEAD